MNRESVLFASLLPYFLRLYKKDAARAIRQALLKIAEQNLLMRFYFISRENKRKNRVYLSIKLELCFMSLDSEQANECISGVM